ncbi:hypothetical protein BDN70DRAFT_925498 [Pholiota conissans]|uniref:Uncharacterized protein n=1 Tax=Pholiota conissans TaxID=109636 RepID=A0A9P5YQE9_9AGAR|nr:hypothetical protein BDN70DRAFT_925498 [Pholiota conissans]
MIPLGRGASFGLYCFWFIFYTKDVQTQLFKSIRLQRPAIGGILPKLTVKVDPVSKLNGDRAPDGETFTDHVTQKKGEVESEDQLSRSALLTFLAELRTTESRRTKEWEDEPECELCRGWKTEKAGRYEKPA